MKRIVYILFFASLLFTISSCNLFKKAEVVANETASIEEVVEEINTKSFPSSNLIVDKVSMVSIDSTLGVKKDEQALEIYNKYKPLHDAEMNEIISYTNVDLLKMPRYNSAGTDGVRNAIIWNFLCDLLYDAWNNGIVKEGLEEIDLVVYNTGGIRSDIAKGDITVGDVYKMVPFDNTLVMVELEYDVLIKLLTYIAERNGWPISKSANLVISDSKVVSMKINGVSIEEGNTYKVVTNDYLIQGGDGITFFSDNVNEVNSGVIVREVVIDYLKYLRSKNITINTQIDERISNEN